MSDHSLAEPETPEPGAFIWQCACGSRNVMSSAVCTKCGNGRPNSATPREPETPEPASAPANGIEIVGLPAGTIKHERTERGTVRLLFTPAPPLTGPNYLDQEEWGHEPAPSDTDTRMFPELRDLCGELEDRSVGADTIGIMYVRQRLEHAVGEAERKAARMLRGGAS